MAATGPVQVRELTRQHVMPTWRTVPLSKISFEGLPC